MAGEVEVVEVVTGEIPKVAAGGQGEEEAVVATGETHRHRLRKPNLRDTTNTSLSRADALQRWNRPTAGAGEGQEAEVVAEGKAKAVVGVTTTGARSQKKTKNTKTTMTTSGTTLATMTAITMIGMIDTVTVTEYVQTFRTTCSLRMRALDMRSPVRAAPCTGPQHHDPVQQRCKTSCTWTRTSRL